MQIEKQVVSRYSQVMSKLQHFGVEVFSVFFILTGSLSITAEPWLNTQDVWLRADIETLSDVGIISVPITTYPMMWAGIVEDFDHTDIEDVPKSYKAAFWRVKKKLKQAFRKQSLEFLRFSAASSSEVLRSFGDVSREKAEISARKYGMSNDWAWDLEVTYAVDPYDGDNIRLDGSYLATVLGNWNISVGYIERWWGPSWDSANLVSNNARPTPAIMLQRNYADLFDYDWLKWVGPWTLNTFIGKLDDERFVSDANLIGMSVTFKPLRSLEIGLRRSAQWGGDGRPEDMSSLFNLLVGRDNCGSDGVSCSVNDNEPGNQLAGVDVRWNVFSDIPTSLYFSAIGEDEAGYLPAKKIFQIGVSSLLDLGGVPWRWYLEYSDTAVMKDRFNITYEHHVYRTGYRYNGKAIGSTYDGDSTALVLGIMGRLSSSSSVYVRLSTMELNRDGTDLSARGGSSISARARKIQNLSLLWQKKFIKRGILRLNFDYYSDGLDDFGRQDDKYRIAIDWTYPINL